MGADDITTSVVIQRIADGLHDGFLDRIEDAIANRRQQIWAPGPEWMQYRQVHEVFRVSEDDRRG
jgi:hypothetical protein